MVQLAKLPLPVILATCLLPITSHAAQPLPGAPILGIDVTEPSDGDFDAAYRAARAAGMQTANLSIFWDDFEIAPSVFDPKINWLTIANLFYASAELPISLTISVLDTSPGGCLRT